MVWPAASHGPQPITGSVAVRFGYFQALPVLASALAMFWPTYILFGLLQVIAALFFLVVVMLRCMCLLPLPKGPGVVAPPVPTTHLPMYTLLVPLFRETAVLNQLLRSLSDLEYPRDRLDIKIILEEEDRPMHQAIANIDLPDYFDIIIVPAGKPQTKPRALNYAMQFARGSLVTIYDSEDIPQPNQFGSQQRNLRLLTIHLVACKRHWISTTPMKAG